MGDVIRVGFLHLMAFGTNGPSWWWCVCWQWRLVCLLVGWKRLGGIFEPSCNSDVVGTEVAGGKGSHNDREVGPPDHQGDYKHPLESLIIPIELY